MTEIEAVVAPDIVVFENGHRNDGWPDFRDNHLGPEMKEPAPNFKTEIIKITSSDKMAWGYTKTTMDLIRKNGEAVEATLWSIYVLERTDGAWKIVILDWSMLVPKAKSAA